MLYRAYAIFSPRHHDYVTLRPYGVVAVKCCDFYMGDFRAEDWGQYEAKDQDHLKPWFN